ncbi:hypothetical protein Tco_0522855 [Tanacetum coccineum]
MCNGTTILGVHDGVDCGRRRGTSLECVEYDYACRRGGVDCMLSDHDRVALNYQSRTSSSNRLDIYTSDVARLDTVDRGTLVKRLTYSVHIHDIHTEMESNEVVTESDDGYRAIMEGVEELVCTRWYESDTGSAQGVDGHSTHLSRVASWTADYDTVLLVVKRIEWREGYRGVGKTRLGRTVSKAERRGSDSLLGLITSYCLSVEWIALYDSIDVVHLAVEFVCVVAEDDGDCYLYDIAPDSRVRSQDMITWTVGVMTDTRMKKVMRLGQYGRGTNVIIPIFKEYISSDVNPLFNEVLEDIENKDSYVLTLDNPALLVTLICKLNEDECSDPGGDFILEEIEACLTSDSIPPGIDDADFNLEGDILLLEKLLNDDPSSPLPPKELNFEEFKVIKFNVSMDFEEDYYDSKGDIIYLECLLIKDTILNLPLEVFLDRDPRSLEDEPDKDDLKNIIKVFDPGIHEKIISPTYDCPDYEDSRAREIPSGESKIHIEVLLVLWENRLPIPDGSLPLSSRNKTSGSWLVRARCDSRLKGGGNNKNNKSKTDKNLLDHGRLAYRCDSFQKGQGSPGRNKTPGPWSARIPM